MTPPSSRDIRSVVVERDIAQPAEKIWRALTQPHLIEEWLMKTDFQPVPGHRFTLRRQQPNVEIVVDGEVLEIEPHKTLSYTWNAFDLESTVTFTLTPTGSGTRLRMEQSGFRPDQKAAYKGARASWPHFLTALEQVLAHMDEPTSNGVDQ